MPLTSQRCPVPPEQLPINEYQDMRESWFYRWGSLDVQAYLRPIVVLWCVSWVVSGPVSAASFAPSKAPLPFMLWAAAGALILPVLALAQLYVGWFHVGQRLRQQTVPYEESGWYDGQVWVKPDEIQNRDRLIVEYQVTPILRRIQKTFVAIAALLSALWVAWQFV